MRRRIQADIAGPLPTRGLEVVEVRDAQALRAFVREWRRLVRLSGRATAPKRGGPAAARTGVQA